MPMHYILKVYGCMHALVNKPSIQNITTSAAFDIAIHPWCYMETVMLYMHMYVDYLVSHVID